MDFPEKNKTLVLIFAQSSKEEAALKGIVNGERLFDTLTEQTIRTIRTVGLPYVRMDETSQTGESFGERFVNAIQGIFEQGYGRIITIGNDTPGLKASHLRSAEKQLATGNFVLGGAADGGFYLMGLHKAQFHKAAFLQLSWQTSRVFNELLVLLSKRDTPVFRLETLHDIDTVNDLRRYISAAKKLSRTLLGIITDILRKPTTGYLYTVFGIPHFYFGISYNKGSPYRY